MKGTNVFATDAEVAELKAAAASAGSAPVIYPFRNPWHAVREKCHACALAHGLPEITGFYGVDLETGEFIQS